MIVPSQVEEVVKVRKVLGSLSRLNGFPEEVVSSIEVAVGEALSNAVRHGSPRGVYDTVEVNYRHVYGSYLEISIVDHGRGFDLEAWLKQVKPLTLSEGQRGLFLIAALMDVVTYTWGPRGGQLYMKKYVDEEAARQAGPEPERKLNHAAFESFREEVEIPTPTPRAPLLTPLAVQDPGSTLGALAGAS